MHKAYCQLVFIGVWGAKLLFSHSDWGSILNLSVASFSMLVSSSSCKCKFGAAVACKCKFCSNKTSCPS